MSIISRAKSDIRLEALINCVEEKVKIKYHRSLDDGWGANFNGQIAEIWYQKCGFESAAFAHELLHIDTQLKGFKRIRKGASAHNQSPLFSRFMTCIDNELQHHKFYNRYIELGFEPEYFCSEPFEEIESYLYSVISANPTELLSVVPDYLTLISLEITHPVEKVVDLMSRFISINNGAFEGDLIKIREIINKWRQSETYDNLPTLRELVLTIYPKPNYTWFGFNSNDTPPDDGFFVDEAFQLQLSS